MLGLAGRDEQIEHMQTTIRNMSRAGIPFLVIILSSLASSVRPE